MRRKQTSKMSYSFASNPLKATLVARSVGQVSRAMSSSAAKRLSI